MPMTTIISPRWENANLTGEVEYPKATRRVIHDPSWPFNQGGCSNLQNWPWTLRSHQSSNFGITSQQLPSEDPVQCGKPNHHPQKKMVITWYFVNMLGSPNTGPILATPQTETNFSW
jgi:hypothetical protein